MCRTSRLEPIPARKTKEKNTHTEMRTKAFVFCLWALRHAYAQPLQQLVAQACMLDPKTQLASPAPHQVEHMAESPWPPVESRNPTCGGSGFPPSLSPCLSSLTVYLSLSLSLSFSLSLSNCDYLCICFFLSLCIFCFVLSVFLAFFSGSFFSPFFLSFGSLFRSFFLSFPSSGGRKGSARDPRAFEVPFFLAAGPERCSPLRTPCVE